jgi:hypothetical protein
MKSNLTFAVAAITAILIITLSSQKSSHGDPDPNNPTNPNNPSSDKSAGRTCIKNGLHMADRFILTAHHNRYFICRTFYLLCSV